MVFIGCAIHKTDLNWPLRVKKGQVYHDSFEVGSINSVPPNFKSFQVAYIFLFFFLFFYKVITSGQA